MSEDEEKKFLDEFRNADMQQKLDMWFYAMQQSAFWDELMDEMSKIARIDQMKKIKK